MSLPAKLVTLRKQAGLTQLELAEKLDVSRQAISKWELGTAVPSTDNLKILSKLYGVSIDALLGEEEIVNAPPPPTAQKEQETKRRNDRGAYVYAALTSTLILLLVFVLAWANRSETAVVLIRDIHAVGDEGYPMETFSLNVSDKAADSSLSAALNTGAYTVSTEPGTLLETPDTRATAAYTVEIGAKTKAQADTGFLLSPGDAVTIKACYVSFSASVDFGLVGPDGEFYYIDVISGSIDRTIKVEQSGKYTLQIRNNADTEIEVVGFVQY